MYCSLVRLGFVSICLLFLFFVWFWYRPQAQSFYFAELLPTSWSDRLVKIVFFCGVSVLFIVVTVLLMSPRQVVSTTRSFSGVDVVFAVDVSLSMHADDILPSRMDATAQWLAQVVGSLDWDRVGMVVFAWQPFLSLPLSFDYGLAATLIERTTPESIDQSVAALQWTAIWDALLASMTILQQWRASLPAWEHREQLIILLTDGDANRWIDPHLVAQLAQEEWISIHTIWIGTVAWWSMLVQTWFGTRRVAIDWIDEGALQRIAATTWWTYTHLMDSEWFFVIDDILARYTPSELKEETLIVGRPYWAWMVWLLLVCSILLVFADRVMVQFGAWTFRRWIVIAIGVCSIIVLFLPYSLQSSDPSSRPVMIMLDLSTSMYVRDITTTDSWTYTSRLNAAQALIKHLVVSSWWVSVWLWGFAWEAVWIVPITSQHDFLLSVLPRLDAWMMRVPGTDITAALRVWAERFVSYGFGSVDRPLFVLITDGWDDPIPLDDELVSLFQTLGIELLVYSLWTVDWWPISIGTNTFGQPVYREFAWEIVISRVNEQWVNELVNTLWWTVHKMTALDQIRSISPVTASSMHYHILGRSALSIQYLLLLVYMLWLTSSGQQLYVMLARFVRDRFTRLPSDHAS